MQVNQETHPQHEPWNGGRIVGAKSPLKPKHIWALRARLQIANRVRDLAMVNLAIDSKLRGCDLVTLEVGDVFSGGGIVVATAEDTSPLGSTDVSSTNGSA